MFEPIAPGDRGPAVEDVQQRLLVLGYDLGPTGVDGVFLGATDTAVRAFQESHDLDEDGVIGPRTWSALVDATFTLGDRLLYLRFPHLHGADVRRLQGALNVLGFACGAPDGIFGAFTERAVREFQANVGLPVDGIAGADTVRMLDRLRHVWEGKDPTSPAALVVAPARAADVLKRARLTVCWSEPCGRDVAERLANLMLASEPDAHVIVTREPCPAPGGLVLHVACDAGRAASSGLPVITLGAEGPAEGRFIAALRAPDAVTGAFVLVPADATESEHVAQACAVRILDGLCAFLSGP